MRPKAPGDLTASEKTLFNEIVAARPAEYFDSATIPMLTEYCRIPSELDLVAGAIRRFKAEWIKKDDGLKRLKELTGMRDKSQKRMVLLATKMRLAQQSRYVPDSGKARPKPGSGPNPWEE